MHALERIKYFFVSCQLDKKSYSLLLNEKGGKELISSDS